LERSPTSEEGTYPGKIVMAFFDPKPTNQRKQPRYLVHEERKKKRYPHAPLSCYSRTQTPKQKTNRPKEKSKNTKRKPNPITQPEKNFHEKPNSASKERERRNNPKKGSKTPIPPPNPTLCRKRSQRKRFKVEMMRR
jgi:hypothetical protein